MKKLLCLLACLSLPLSLPAQQSATSPTIPTQEAEPKLTRFNLDFPGGTPGELTAAIQKAMGRPVNVIIPTEHADFRLPALKMSGVTVPQLFRSLTLGGKFNQSWPHPNGTIQQVQGSFGFDSPGVSSEETVWFFYVNNRVSSLSTKATRFHLLTPYLDAGLTVDDITTAIRTAWKMRGDAATPALSFHKETKLLIAVGETSQLSTVDDVLRALDASRTPRPSNAAPKSDERKTER
jgi:hypothetical protein